LADTIGGQLAWEGISQEGLLREFPGRNLEGERYIWITYAEIGRFSYKGTFGFTQGHFSRDFLFSQLWFWEQGGF